MSNSENQRTLSLVERIQANYKLLKNAERIVADHLMKNPNQLLDSSITEFSRKLGVSEATISRFSKAVGYDGFPALKLSIASQTTTARTLPNLPSEIRETDTFDEVTDKLLATLTLSMQMTKSSLDMQLLEEAVAQISDSRRIVFVGVGGAASICVEAMHLFMKAGRQVEAIADGYTQITAATALSQGDLIVGISHTGQTQSVAQALSIASSRDAATIAITSNPKSLVASAADIVLTTWNNQTGDVPFFGDFLEGRMSQLFLIDLLYLNSVFKAQNGEKDNLMLTGDALSRYYENR